MSGERVGFVDGCYLCKGSFRSAGANKYMRAASKKRAGGGRYGGGYE